MKPLDIAVVVSQLMTSAGPDGTPLYCAAGSQMGQNQNILQFRSRGLLLGVCCRVSTFDNSSTRMAFVSRLLLEITCQPAIWQLRLKDR